MTATALDSAIFRDIFSTAAMRRVFSDEARTGHYLEIEAALARAQARLGIIPERAAREIVRQCRIENMDLARLKQQTERIGYPILGVVQQALFFELRVKKQVTARDCIFLTYLGAAQVLSYNVWIWLGLPLGPG